ncbi:MAG: hypothetical protein JKY48_12155 [Flavobacteriales bacterium]|nr:hypothetical protein [Flavobacteriales bacterium]
MFSIISGAIGLLGKIYEAQKTASYRQDVLAGIQQIESMLDAVMSELKKIEAMVEWSSLITEIKGSDGTINNLFQYDDIKNWLKWDGTGTAPTISEETINEIKTADIDNCLHFIDTAIMGNLTSSNAWLELFIKKTDNSSSTSSKIEETFAFMQVIYLPFK